MGGTGGGLRCVAAWLSLFAAVQVGVARTNTTAPTGEFDTAIDRAIDGLANLEIREEVSRYAGVGDQARQLDTFEAEVSIADGSEQYSKVRSGNRVFEHVSEIRGLWSFGELVTILQTSRDIIRSGRTVSAEKTDDSVVIAFQAAAEDHLWFVMAGGRVVWLGFEGTLRISSKTGEIRNITWNTCPGSPGSGIAAILWEVDFDTADVFGEAETMPTRSRYRVCRSGRKGAEWNITHYAVIGRYGSTTNVSFGE